VSKVTVAPLAYVHVLLSALSVPISVLAGRQLWAAAAVVFQQLSLESHAQSSVPPGPPPELPPVPELDELHAAARTAIKGTTLVVENALMNPPPHT
jgi:hypothetical protein